MVSIILPNLNTPLRFLIDRLISITDQCYLTWECVVIDGYSTNGTWEYITAFANTDKRFVCYQLPPKGIYNAWNEGILRAKGEYIYIATSDDICDKNLLKKMVSQLEVHTDCDIAHCCLQIIDEHGELCESQWRDWGKVKFYGELIEKPHKRPPGYDAIAHFGWSTIYTSIVQLLFRRTLFDKVGLFAVEYGSLGDFEWELRASLVTGTIHVPEYLASWRKHSSQATDDTFFSSYQFYVELLRMSRDALKRIGQRTTPSLFIKKEIYFYYLIQVIERAPRWIKVALAFKYFVKYPALIGKVFFHKALKKRTMPDTFVSEQLVLHRISRPTVC
jgi:glycosyltransferase involved in cell wall biosynthesis